MPTILNAMFDEFKGNNSALSQNVRCMKV